jgi:hypothetical protein
VPTDIRAKLLAETSKLAEARVPPMQDDREHQQLTRTLHESFVHSFRMMMLIASVTALLGAVCAALMIRDAPSGNQGQGHA